MGNMTAPHRAVNVRLVADRITERPHRWLTHHRILTQGRKRRGHVTPAGEYLLETQT